MTELQQLFLFPGVRLSELHKLQVGRNSILSKLVIVAGLAILEDPATIVACEFHQKRFNSCLDESGVPNKVWKMKQRKRL
jgi:hypothetical protein